MQTSLELPGFEFSEVEWETAADQIRQVRQKVFLIEQHFEQKMLEDTNDPFCYHILVTNESGEAVGCGRLNPDGRIGRIAVLMTFRGQGIGTALLSKLVSIAQQTDIPSLTLNAETDLCHFYDQQKFRRVGPVFMKQGVPHQRMTKRLR